MAGDLILECDCGAISGTLSAEAAAEGSWLVCHCRDCQAFVHHLDKGDGVLDDHAGTPLVQTRAFGLQIGKGEESLASVRVTDGKLLRWYCRECRTPIANTMMDGKWPFLSLIAYPLKGEKPAAADDPVHVFTESGCGDTSGLKTGGALKMVARAFGRILRDKWQRKGRTGAFFDAEGRPIARPHLLTGEERKLADSRAREFCESRAASGQPM